MKNAAFGPVLLKDLGREAYLANRKSKSVLIDREARAESLVGKEHPNDCTSGACRVGLEARKRERDRIEG
jgi:hypothetical protein